MHRVKRWLVLLTLLGLSVPALPVRAQTSPSITELQVALWPEYDRPSMLVIYRVHLDPATELPTNVSLPIPASVGEPAAVAMTDPTGELVYAQYTRQVNGEWATISAQAESLDLQIEYYSSLTFDGQLRRFTFVWPGGDGVKDLSYEVQGPIGSDQVTLVPPPQSQAPRQDGLTYYMGSLGPDAALSGTQIEISYVKATSDLSAELLSLPPTRPESTQGSTPDLRQYLPWIPLIFGIILLAAGGVWYFRLSRAAGATGGRQRHRTSRPSSPQEVGEIDASPVFCHNCGTRSTASDRFCRTCGVRLRQ